MKSFIPHAVFSLILAVSVTTNAVSTTVVPAVDTTEPAVVDVAASYGWTLRQKTKDGESIQTLTFDAPDCARPVLVSLLHLLIEEQQFLPAVDQSYVARFIYIEDSWNSPDRFTLFLAAKRQRALVVLGLRRDASDRMLYVSAPSECPSIQTVNWRSVWNKEGPK